MPNGQLRILVACARPLAARFKKLRVTFDSEVLHAPGGIDGEVFSFLRDERKLTVLAKEVEKQAVVYHLGEPLPSMEDLMTDLKMCGGVLGASHSNGERPLDVFRPGEEAQAVRATLGRLHFSAHVARLDHVKPRDLREHLDSSPGYDVLYLICHGNEAGVLLLEDGRGWARHVDARELAEIVGGKVKILLLGACYGERSLKVLLEAPEAGRPSVMVFAAGEYPIPARAVSLFSEEFFRSLAQGGSCEAAFAQRIECVRWDDHVGECSCPDGALDHGPSPCKRFRVDAPRQVALPPLAEGNVQTEELHSRTPIHCRMGRIDDIVMGREIAAARLVEELLPARAGLREDKRRLIHLHGEGGIGKTRLAQAVCDTLEDYGHFLGGIYELDCENLTDERQLAVSILRILNAAAAERAVDPTAGLIDCFRKILAADGGVLIMLDNLDPLFMGEGKHGAASLLVRILSECPEARFLSTCRTTLNLAGYESNFSLDPLEDPVAVELFLRTIPDEDVQEEVRALPAKYMGHLVDLVKLLHGHPLSIFLAAHRISEGPDPVSRQIVKAKENIVGFLHAPELLGLPARQRSLRASLGLSHSLLSDRGREAFRKSALFPGGISGDGSTTEELQGTAWVEGLSEAAAVGLLRFDREEQRYRMLNPVREYAAELLAGEEGDEFGREVAGHWGRCATSWDLGLNPVQSPEFFASLNLPADGEERSAELARLHKASFGALCAEETNIMFSFRRALENDRDVAEAIATSMMDYFKLRGKRQENAWMARAVLGVSAEPAVRAKWLHNLGIRLSELGERSGALEATREALEIRRKLAQSHPEAFLPDVAMTLNNLGMMLSELGERSGALEATREALEIYRKLSESHPEAFLSDVAMTLNNLGIRLSELGDRSGALEATQEALEIRRKLAQSHPEAFLPYVAGTLNNLGAMLSELGERSGALEATREALEIYRKLSESHPEAFLPDVARTLNNLGNRLSELGERSAALEATREGLEKYRELSKSHPEAFLPYVAMTLNNLGKMLSELGDRSGAIDCFLELISAVRRHVDLTGYPGVALEACSRLLGILPGLGDTPDVLPVLEGMIELVEPLAAKDPSAVEILTRATERRRAILEERPPAWARRLIVRVREFLRKTISGLKVCA